MSADIRPHTYRPLPTPKPYCATCLGTVRNDFCKETWRSPKRPNPTAPSSWGGK